MIRFHRTQPLKLRGSTPLTRFLARPLVRFGIAGGLSVVISFLLLLFMMYISQNFSRSSMESQILYDLEMVKQQNQAQPRNVLPPKPPGLDEVTEPPGREQIRRDITERQQASE